jgi:hypothetical protein
MGIPFEKAGNLDAVREDLASTNKLTTKRFSALLRAFIGCQRTRKLQKIPVVRHREAVGRGDP